MQWYKHFELGFLKEKQITSIIKSIKNQPKICTLKRAKKNLKNTLNKKSEEYLF